MQKSNATKLNRYPKIFSYLKKNFEDKSKNILSYGCSDGSECITIKNYFPNANIYGTDIIIKDSYDKDNIKYFPVKNFPNIKFDLIMINAVLCNFAEKGHSGWGWGPNTTTISNFNTFDKYINLVDKFLNIGGVILMTNANYLFTDSSVSHKYKPLEFTENINDYDKRKDNTTFLVHNYVPIYDRENNRIFPTTKPNERDTPINVFENFPKHYLFKKLS
jgi:hypothetical protein